MSDTILMNVGLGPVLASQVEVTVAGATGPTPLGDALAASTVGATGATGPAVPTGYPREISGTTGALTAGDNGLGVQCTNAGAVTLTVPTGLGAFQCFVMQMGAGAVTITNDGTTTVAGFSGVATAGQYAIVSLVSTEEDVFVVGGAAA